MPRVVYPILFFILLLETSLTIHTSSHLFDEVAGDVFVVLHHLVDDAIRSEFDDAISYGLDEFVVVAAEEDIAFVEFQVVIERLDALKVEVVGGGVEDKTVGILQLHTGNHATHLFATREDIGFLQYLLATKKHTAKEALEVHFVAFTKLAEPIDEVEIRIEKLGVIEGQIGGGDGYAPIEATGMGLAMTTDNLEEGGHGAWVAAEEDNLIALLDVEVHIAEEHSAIFHLGTQVVDRQDLVSGLTLGSEDDARVLAR